MTEGISRRRFLRQSGLALGAIGAGGLLSACATDGGAGTSTIASMAPTAGPTTSLLQSAQVGTQLSWIKNVQFAGWFYADAEELFAEEAIEPEFFSGAEAIVEEVVAGGSTDVGIVGFLEGVVDAVIGGSEFVVFGAQYQESPAGLMSMPDNPIRTPEDILGKRIGVQGEAREFETILRLAGLPADDFTPVPVGFDPAPLVEGQVDGYFSFVTNQPLILQAQGLDPVVVTLAELGFAQYADVLIARRDYFESNREVLARWLRATIKGWELNNANLQQGTDYTLEVGRDLGLDPDQQLAQNTAQKPLMESSLTAERGLFWIDKAIVAGVMYDGLRASGREGLPDVDTLIDTSILEMAFDGATTLTGT